MAKKQTPNPSLPQQTSSTESNLFMKGMIKDTFPSISGKEVWEHAINVINNSIDGDTGVIGNEPANFECAEIPYTIIGSIHIYGDHWAIFSTDDFSSEIGTFDDSKCEYTRLINDQCLNFNREHLIIGAAKENFECKYQIYWDDSVNPSRTLTLEDPPYLRIEVSGPSLNGAPCSIYENIQPLTLDCERIRLAPLIDTPCLDLQKAPEGGSLRNGMYQAFIAYTINEQVYGDFIGISNQQSLFEHDDSAGSLILTLSHLDKNFDNYKLVILGNNQEEFKFSEVGEYSTEQTTIKLDYLDQKLKSVPTEYMNKLTPALEKSKGMFVVNDYLVRTQPTNQFDFNYQPLANRIACNWTSVEYPADYYYNGGNKPTFLRDERYAFFIRFIYNTGERSSSYHIPGRAATYYSGSGVSMLETDVIPGDPNALDPTDQIFKVHNTAFVSQLNVNTVQPDGGILRTRGEMGYWESTELYPQDAVRWGDLCGMPIRHHKMPDENTANNGTTDRATPGGTGIYNIAVEFTGIPWPRDNAGNLIPNIVGYEFLVGSREGHKSILGKGILKNMEQYIPSDPSASDGSTSFFIPNYPYNDLTSDPYIKGPGGGGSVGYDSWSGLGYEDWLQGCDNPTGPYNRYSNSVFTFHSPDLMFNRPFLNAYELKSYGVISGTQTGRFKPSEKHPGEKLLRNSTAVLAAFIGVGYAIYAMRGSTDQKMTTGRVLDMGYREEGEITKRSGNNGTFSGGGAWTNLAGSSYNTGTWTGAGGGKGTFNASAPNNDRWQWTSANQISAANRANSPGTGTYDTAANGLFLGLGGITGGAASNKAGAVTWQAAQATNWQGQAGSIGPGQEIVQKGTKFSNKPFWMGLISGAQEFMNFVSTGGQEIIDLIYNLTSFKQYVYKYNSHGWYRNMSANPNGSIFRHSVNKSRYLNGAISQLTPSIRINNLNRPLTVAVELETNGNVDVNGLPTSSLPLPTGDNSKYTIGTAPGQCDWTNPGGATSSGIAAHYCAMKYNIDNQYGQLEDIKQIPIRGCVEFFEDQILLDASGNPIINNLIRFNSKPLFGGDCYVNRYTEKAIMPFFWDYLAENEKDGFVWDYRLYPNVPFPTYWMNTEKYRLDELTKQLGGVNFAFAIASGFNGAFPNDYYYMDRDPASCSGGGLFSSFNDATNSNPGSLFTIHDAYMYLHCNGINDFFVESELNLAQRDWGEDIEKRHYDSLTFSALTDLFHVDGIKKGNYYKYDKSLSIEQNYSRTLSWGFIQPRSYDPTVAEKCYITWNKRLVYSLQAKKEAKKDFWRVFLPLNYKEFKDSVNTIKPISKTGAIVLFPKLSPQIFTGNDELTTDAGTKVVLGDGGLFAERNWRDIVNSDISHEYGSSESSRAVLNTPMGLFFISQEQGKIFQTEGNSLINITNTGMKWWFNKYLPSQLLATFPDAEACPQMIDNPVVSAGCQTVYDTNNDIVYFSKRDFAVTNAFANQSNNCIEYVPCEGFYLNETICNGASQIVTCPDGYTYNSVSEMCELITYDLPFGPPAPACKLDIVLSIDASYSVPLQSNVNSMRLIVQGILDVFDNAMSLGDTQIGIMAWGTRAYDEGSFNATAIACNGLRAPVALTFNPNLLNQTTGFMSEYTCASGTSACCPGVPCGGNDCNVTGGTGYGDAVWSGTNWLFNPTPGPGGTGARPNVPKKLIILNDGWDATSTGWGGTNPDSTGADRALTRPNYINLGQTSSFVATPTTPPMVATAPDTGVVGNISAAQPDNLVQWIQTNIHANAQYQDPTNSNFLGQLEIIPGWLKNNNTPTAAEEAYAQSIAGYDAITGDPNPYMAGDFQAANVQGIINDLVEKICPGILPNCPSGCTPVIQGGVPMCECIDEVPATYEDVLTYIPYQLENPTYFQDVSWTVSYDPKAKAWISFHDWHPELAFNSINHFMTSKTTTTEIPQCPPGYSFNSTLDECCITVAGSDPAFVEVKYIPSDTTVVDSVQTAFSVDTDIALVMDVSGSTALPGCIIPFPTNCTFGVLSAQVDFCTAFVNVMSPGMASGTNNVRIGFGVWDNANSAQVTGLTSNDSTLIDPIAGSISTYDETSASYTAGGTNYETAVLRARAMLSGSTATKKVVIIITDTQNNTCAASPPNNISADLWTWNAAGGGDVDTIAVFADTVAPANNGWWTNLNCLVQLGTAAQSIGNDAFAVDSSNYGDVAVSVMNSLISCDCPVNTVPDIPSILCSPDPGDPLPQCVSCECPAGYTQVPVNQVCNSLNPPTCKKVDCNCPPIPVLDPSLATTWFEAGTQCDDLFLVDTPGYVNPNPLICNWEYKQCVPANYTVGGMWKHNVRNDLFVNYYGEDFPWEVTLIENTGQVVNTLRSIEYQQESYVYKNFNLPRPQQLIGTDRFHDLDWNFDETIIYNSEQVSGLLTLDLTPKNNIVLLNQYPIINNPTDIQILYSKEEQKYRFNQFWDITDDRGEFTGVERPIWITTLNGYIKNLNQANLNYIKAPLQRKKFRHYYNMIVLRKNVSGDRKMLLKLNNTKMNISFR